MAHLHALPHIRHCHGDGVSSVQPGHGSSVVAQSFEMELIDAKSLYQNY